MSDKPKTTRVYLMVECEMQLHCEPKPEKVKGLAKEQIETAIMHTADNITGNVSWFDLGNGGMRVGQTTILPDNIQEILFRESIKHLPLHEQLRQVIAKECEKHPKERWDKLIKAGIINEQGDPLLRTPWNEDEWEDDDE